MKPCPRAAAVLALLLPFTLSVGSASAEETKTFPKAGQSESGALGLGRLTQALPGEKGVVRVGLRGGFFQGGAFPGPEAEHRLLAGQLAASWTALSALEVFGAYRFSSNNNSLESPKIVQAQGDLLIGAKVGTAFDRLELGADLRFDLRNGIGADLPTLDGSTVQIRALGSQSIPVAGGAFGVHFNVGGAFGRSEAALDERMTEGLLFSTGFSAYHRLLMGVGARYDLGLVSPFATLDLDLPMGVGNSVLNDAGVNTFEAGTKRITLGVEVKTSVATALQLAAELGFGSGVAGFAPTQPWMLTAGWSFAFDPSLYSVRAPEHTPAQTSGQTPASAPEPATGNVAGRIIDKASSAPVAGAFVRLAPEGPPVATDAEGRFVSYAHAAGPVTLSVEKEGFVSATFNARVTAGETVTADASLTKSPPPPTALEGLVAGHLTSTKVVVSARVVFEGKKTVELTTENGRFNARLAPGKYRVKVLSEQHHPWSGEVVVEADQAVPLIAALEPVPPSADFTQQGQRLEPVRSVVLDEKTPSPDPDAAPVFQKIVEWLVAHPTQMLVVGVHSDAPAKGKDDRKAWTQQRADAIRNALIALGAPSERVEAAGFGLEQPLVPTRVLNKAPNRRVEFVVSEIKPPDAPVPEPVKDAAETAPLPPADEFLMDLPPPMLPPDVD